MDNDQLRAEYNKIYSEGKEKFFSKFDNGKDISETEEVVWSATKWTGKTVLDIGCGTGEIIAGIKDRGAANVIGIDYAESAIEIAKRRHNNEDTNFLNQSLDDFVIDPSNFEGGLDVVISLGTIEHMDSPDLALKKMLSMLKNTGELIITCPYFINIRGIIWMSLALLLDVPMSLTDKHFISPFDIRKWLLGTGFSIVNIKYFDYERANGNIMLEDMENRLSNAMNDAKLPNDNVPVMIEWLSSLVNEEKQALNYMGGASALYVIKKEI
jgi:2-polyprenyl-3-methyl-5-hydroxy-6-metoxy-1,4-benzoquinol methylase